ncbi:apoptosis facilitator Bcl-2-like protein 14 [Rhinoderma darwinii]|uniref:apoptosis facilitator Bcl-2-like protein 14 n=1 Tax=Rhinoderma darwinii TaxID=43563 RepID=UPI003F67AE8F
MVSVQDDALDEVPLQEEDSLEFRVLMVYAQRGNFQDLRSRTSVEKKDGVTSNGEGHAVDSSVQLNKVKKKKKRLRWRMTPKCLQPPKEKNENLVRSAGNPDDARARVLVERLRAIVRKVEKPDQEAVGFRSFRRQCSVQHDGDVDDDLIEDIVQFLRTIGDEENKKCIQKQQTLLQRLQACWSYDFFQRLTDNYVSDLVPVSEPEDVQQSSRIALCVHATTKLTALDHHPMNRMCGFGARYLKENYSQWIKDHGGWEKVMGVPENFEEE